MLKLLKPQEVIYEHFIPYRVWLFAVLVFLIVQLGKLDTYMEIQKENMNKWEVNAIHMQAW